MYGFVLLLHVLGATVWTGGHVVLAVGVLPGVLRERAVDRLLAFEAMYERLGLSALVLQVITGLWLARRLLPEPDRWLDPGDPTARLVLAKLGLLALTVALAAHARLRLLPGLDARTLPWMAVHVIAVTVLSIAFVVVGVWFRAGWPH